jgi:hypothetical protein
VGSSGVACVGACGDAANPSMGARWRHPWRQHPAIPHRPAPDRFPVTVVDPRHAWMKSVRSRIESGSDPFSCGKRISFRQLAGNCRRRGGSGCGCERHGCRDRAPRDGFTASPQPDPPRHPTEARCCLLLLPARRVQGAALPIPLPGRAGRIGVSAVIRSRRCASPSSTCTPPRKPPATPS